MNKMNDTLNKFADIKQSGANGEKLASDVIHVTKKINQIITDFESGSQDPAWVASLINMAGEETMVYAQNIYLVLKETQAKLEALEV